MFVVDEKANALYQLYMDGSFHAETKAESDITQFYNISVRGIPLGVIFSYLIG